MFNEIPTFLSSKPINEFLKFSNSKLNFSILEKYDDHLLVEFTNSNTSAVAITYFSPDGFEMKFGLVGRILIDIRRVLSDFGAEEVYPLKIKKSGKLSFFQKKQWAWYSKKFSYESVVFNTHSE